MALTASPLFGTPDTRSQSRNLVEFRAGKMFMSHGNMVHPDTRKGLVYVYQSNDGLMHFCWKDRTTGTVEDVSPYPFLFFFFFLVVVSSLDFPVICFSLFSPYPLFLYYIFHFLLLLSLLLVPPFSRFFIFSSALF